jgi:hypothetical protein
VVYAAPPNPCRMRQYSMIKIALEGIDAFHRCAGDKILALEQYARISNSSS